MWLPVLVLALPLASLPRAVGIQVEPHAGDPLNASAPVGQAATASAVEQRPAALGGAQALGVGHTKEVKLSSRGARFRINQTLEALASHWLAEQEAEEETEAEEQAAAEAEEYLRKKTAHRLTLGLLTALMVGAAVPFLWMHHVLHFVALLVYLVSIVVVKLCVQQVFSSGYPYPYATTAFQMMVTGIVASCIERPTVSGARSSLTIAVVKSASLALNNMALIFGTSAVASLVGALLPATTYGIELYRHREPTTPRTLGVLAACSGAMLCVKGELACSPLAVVLILGACVCRSLKTVWSHDFMQDEGMSPCRLAAWTAIWCSVIMVPVTLIKEGGDALAAFVVTSAYTKIVFFAGAFLAAGLNVIMCYVLKFLGPLLQNIYGQLELVLVLTLSVSWYQDSMGIVQWMGAVLISLGCVLANADGTSAIKRLHRLWNVETMWPSDEPVGA